MDKGNHMSKSTKNKLMTFASFACVLHCILAPFIVMAAPMLGHLFENIFVEIALLIISITCGIMIVYNGYCTHKRKHSAILFIIGVSFWGINTIIELMTDLHINLELLIIGTIIVLIAYKINHNDLKKCCASDDH